MFRLLPAAILGLLFAVPAFSTDFYTASSGGSDTANNCQTLASPCNLANGFANEFTQIGVGTGDTLWLCAAACNGSGVASAAASIASFTYPDGLTISGYAGETVTIGTVTLNNDANVTLKNFKIDARVAGSSLQGLDITDCQNVLVDGLDIGWADDHGVAGGQNAVMGVSDNITIQNTVIHDWVQDQTNTPGGCPVDVESCGQHGIYIVKTNAGADEHWYLTNVEFYNGQAGVRSDINWAIHIYGGVDSIGVVQMNKIKIHHVAHAVLITACTNCYIANFEIWDATYDGVSLGLFGAAATNPAAYNGSISGTTNCLNYGAYNSTAINVACYGNTKNTPNVPPGVAASTLTSTTNSFGANPLWTDAANGDFTFIMDGSPLVDVGTNLSAIFTATDFNGISRPQAGGWDIGAIERVPGVGGPGSGNTRGTPIITENCTGAAGALSTGYVQLNPAVLTVNRDGSGRCTGSTSSIAVSGLVQSTGTFAASQYATGVFRGQGSGTDGSTYPSLCVKCTSDQNALHDGYEFSVYNDAGTVYSVIAECVNGTCTPRASATNVAWTSGDVMALEFDNVTGHVYGFKNTSVIVDYLDPSPLSGGKPGFGANGGALIDDIELGDLTPGCQISITAPQTSQVATRPGDLAINWTSAGCTGNFDLQYSFDGGVAYLPIATVAYNSAPYTFDLDAQALGRTTDFRVRVLQGAVVATQTGVNLKGRYLK